MPHPTRTPALTIGRLEGSYPLYCKALRILIREGKSLEEIQRSVCWDRLAILHRCLPGQYRDPTRLYQLLKLEVTGAVNGSQNSSLRDDKTDLGAAQRHAPIDVQAPMENNQSDV